MTNEYMQYLAELIPEKDSLNFFCEETLYLACPEAARLFLASAAGDRPFEQRTQQLFSSMF